jgi:hypothetical protein
MWQRSALVTVLLALLTPRQQMAQPVTGGLEGMPAPAWFELRQLEQWCWFGLHDDAVTQGA